MAARLEPDSGQPAAHVLVLEDCPQTSAHVRQALQRAGLQVSIVATAERALELATREPFDLLLLDLSSPGLHTIEACHALRKEPATRDTPMVLLASWETSKAVVDEVRQLGASDVISKPFQTLDFLARVLGSLRSHARQTADLRDWLRNL